MNLQEDQHGEFQFLLSHVISPDEIYVHPVSDISGKLVELEDELTKRSDKQRVANKKEIVVGSMWAVKSDMWYRARVILVTSDNVKLQSVDYGHYIQVSIADHHLHRLPQGLASTLPCLAVRCHLAQCSKMA